MYEYNRKSRLGFGSIFLIILFSLTIIFLSILFFINKGKFWDLLPIISVAIIILSLIFAIFNVSRRASGGFIFILFFLLFIGGLIISSIYGPFALSREAQQAIDSENYLVAIKNYNEIINKYSTSRYYEESLKNIVYAYQKTGDYNNTIKYINLCVEKNILDRNSLEVKKILSESYSKIAESSYKDKEYETASLNFILAVNTLRDIIKNFPNSDEAFIASYKIPEYLFKAADCNNKIKNYEQAISLLTELVEDYPENDFAEQAKPLVFDNYFKDILNLIEKSEYKEALDKYMLAKNITSKAETNSDSGISTGNNSINMSIKFYDDQVYSRIPQDILFEYGTNLITSEESKNALSIFEYLLENYPEMEEEINPYYAICKTAIIKNEIYENLPQIKEDYKTRNEDYFILTIINSTAGSLNFYISNNSANGSNVFKLKPKSRVEINMPGDTYNIAAEIINDSNEVEQKFFGSFNFENKKKYSQTFLLEIKKQ